MGRESLPFSCGGNAKSLNTLRSNFRSFEEDTHAFLVRVWQETREIDGEKPIWRGVIEHVATKERRYLKKPEEIIWFIDKYLRNTAAEQPSMFQKARRWLNNLRAIL